MSSQTAIDLCANDAINLDHFRELVFEELGLLPLCQPDHVYRVIVSASGVPTSDGVHQPLFRTEFFSSVPVSDDDRERLATLAEDYIDDCLPAIYEEATAVVEVVPILKRAGKKARKRDESPPAPAAKVRKAVGTVPVVIDLTGDDKEEEKGVPIRVLRLGRCASCFCDSCNKFFANY